MTLLFVLILLVLVGYAVAFKISKSHDKRYAAWLTDHLRRERAHGWKD